MRTLLSAEGYPHAPTSTREAILSAYIGGMIGANCGVQLSADGVAVLYNTSQLLAFDGALSRIADLTFEEVREVAKAGLKFAACPAGYRATIDSVDTLLDIAPTDFQLVLSLDSPSDTLLRAIARDLFRHPQANVAFRIPVADDPSRLLALFPRAFLVVQAAGEEDLASERLDRAHGVAMHATDLLLNGRPTALATKLARRSRRGGLPAGVVILPRAAVPTPHELDVAATWGAGDNVVESASHLTSPQFVREKRLLVSESFAGKRVETNDWSIGYARSNPYCHVYQDDGLHIKIDPFPEARPPADGPEGRLASLEHWVLEALYRAPAYSGGGVGYNRGIVGDFSSECTLKRERSAQASTAEMAITNVDPGRHIPSWNADGSPQLPRSPHDMHTFFDTHGAPPYVGAEQDENDGFRISWNLGTSHYDNQYGANVGSGTCRECGLRIERRGPCFASYFRENHAEEWIVAGVTRNDSLNARVFLRFVGKRWEKTDPANPGRTLPVVSNHFVFSDVNICLTDTNAPMRGPR